ncbi:hypothetical protein ABIB90_007979 [Bradyrhizobium sp. JR4.1]
MIAIAFPRMMSKLVATLRVVGREPGVSDRGGQDKSRKVRPVGCARKCIDFNDRVNITGTQSKVHLSPRRCSYTAFGTLRQPE